MSQVLRTYEGRRLHEKLQHVAKLNMELAAAPQMDAEEGRSADDIIELKCHQNHSLSLMIIHQGLEANLAGPLEGGWS